jgi:hypothetical protein
MNSRIDQILNVEQHPKVLERKFSDLLSEVRFLPHNLDYTGNTSITPFKLFRVGRGFYFYDSWGICYRQVIMREV